MRVFEDGLKKMARKVVRNWLEGLFVRRAVLHKAARNTNREAQTIPTDV
jgi:hypothetical protein